MIINQVNFVFKQVHASLRICNVINKSRKYFLYSTQNVSQIVIYPNNTRDVYLYTRLPVTRWVEKSLNWTKILN